MKRLVLKRQHVLKWKIDYAPRILEKKNGEIKEIKWEVEWNGSGKHEIYCENIEKRIREQYQSCTCRSWDISGVPCQHAMATIIYEEADPLNYLSTWFNKETYLMAYNNMLNPVKG